MKAKFLLVLFAYLMVANVVAQQEAVPVCEVNGQRPTDGALCVNWRDPAAGSVHYTPGNRITTDLGEVKFGEKKSIELRGALNYDNSDPGPFAKEDRKWNTGSHMKISIEFMDLSDGTLIETATPKINERIEFRPGTRAQVVVIYGRNPYGPRVVSMNKSKSTLRAYVY